MDLKRYDAMNIKVKKQKGYFQRMIDEFMDSNIKRVECIFSEGEYSSASSARSTIARAIEISKRNCRVIQYHGHIYLENLDL